MNQDHRAPQGEPAAFRRGQTLSILRDNEAPLQSPNTRIVAAALASGATFANDRPLIDAIESTPEGPKRTVTWCMSGDRSISFRPNFAEETLAFDQFRERFDSREWCEANPDHPIAYMRAFSEQMNRLRDRVKTMRPMLMVRKGRRTALIPSDCSEERKAEILGIL